MSLKYVKRCTQLRISLNIYHFMMKVFNSDTFRYSFKISLIFASWVPVVYTVQEHFVQIYRVKGSSMSPTFNESNKSSDYVLVYKWDLKKPGNLSTNDVVMFRSPLEPEKILTKRIKGIQSDEIVTRYPYPKPLVTIPRNHLWVEGDNIHSIDSNTFGPISSGLVVGKVLKIIYPFSRFGDVPSGGREARHAIVKKLDDMELN